MKVMKNNPPRAEKLFKFFRLDGLKYYESLSSCPKAHPRIVPGFLWAKVKIDKQKILCKEAFSFQQSTPFLVLPFRVAKP